MSEITADDWKAYTPRRLSQLSELGDHIAIGYPNAIPLLIAIANDLLPDSDPRKITSEKIQSIRDVLGIVPSGPVKDEVNAFADALESYLPPET